MGMNSSHTLAPLLKCIVLLSFMLLTINCTQKEPEKTCNSDTECAFGMVCSKTRCVDRGLAGEPHEDKASIHAMLKSEQDIASTTIRCQKSAECLNRGKCQGTPEGHCIVAQQSHCENASVTCKEEGKCTYVPEEYACCESTMGSVCERP